MQQDREILLVEDDLRDVRLTTRELLTVNPNTRIHVARDGEEALDFLFCRGVHANRSPGQPPALILLDLKIPKLDGLQVLREIKNFAGTRAIPVVALTSSREEKDRIESYRLGINSYIQKPVNFDEFRHTIRTLGQYWLGINQPPPDKAFAEDSMSARSV
jgi:two-component system response regulator